MKTVLAIYLNTGELEKGDLKKRIQKQFGMLREEVNVVEEISQVPDRDFILNIAGYQFYSVICDDDCLLSGYLVNYIHSRIRY